MHEGQHAHSWTYTAQHCQQVQMAPDCIGDEVQAIVDNLQSGQVRVQQTTVATLCQIKVWLSCMSHSSTCMLSSMCCWQVLLLENVRFHKQEEKNDPEFAKKVQALS